MDSAVVVAVHDLRNNTERSVEAAAEPAELAARAVRGALGTLPASAAGLVDALSVVSVVSWAYDDLPAEIAARAGITPRISEHTDVGGNRPVELLDRAAARVTRGQTTCEVICGAEAARSVQVLAKAGVTPPWTMSPGGRARLGKAKAGTERMWRHGVVGPPRVYPLYENRLRHDLGQSFAEAHRWSAEMYADFSVVAAGNPAAWDHGRVRSAEEIAEIGPANRMISWPYPLLMNAMPAVDQAAAVVVMTATKARELGIDEAGLVHVWGGAGSADSTDVLDRTSYGRAPALEAVLDTVLDRAGLTPDDIDAWDLYSCFPVVPKIAALHLGLGREVRLTQTGGLTAFGGPANNYSMHAIAATTRAMRRGASFGLVYGNGEYLTKHHAVVLSAQPHPDGYCGVDGPVTPYPATAPTFADVGSGPVTVETYTVEFDREGSPEVGTVIVRDVDGRRLAATSRDAATLAWLTDPDVEPIGRRGRVEPTGEGTTSFAMAKDGDW